MLRNAFSALRLYVTCEIQFGNTSRPAGGVVCVGESEGRAQGEIKRNRYMYK